MPHLHRNLVTALITAMLCLHLSSSVSAQHQSPAERRAAALAPTANFNWTEVLPELNELISKTYPRELEQYPVHITLDSITQTSYLAGDGTPFALVSFPGGGAYTNDVVAVRVIAEHPTLVRFRDGHGKFSDEMIFVEGASAKHAVSVSFAADKHAIYTEELSFDGGTDGSSQKVDSCKVGAYQWVASTQSMNLNRELTRQMAEAKCSLELGTRFK